MSIIIALEQVSVKLADMDRLIIKECSFTLYEHDCVIVLGGNGSGKSSLLKVMNRTLKATHGHVQTYRQDDIITLTQDMSHSLFYDLTVLENCLLWGLKNKALSFKIRTLEERAYYKTYVGGYHHNLALKLDKPVRTLSGGEKQALLLALCLHAEPKVLLLDEHTSALDPIQSAQMMQRTYGAIMSKQITSVIITHNLNHALQFGNRIIALKDGVLVFQAEGEEKKALKRQDLVRFCF